MWDRDSGAGLLGAGSWKLEAGSRNKASDRGSDRSLSLRVLRQDRVTLSLALYTLHGIQQTLQHSGAAG